MKILKKLLSAGFGLALGLQATLVCTSQAAQVDLGLTLGSLTTGSSILSGKAVRLGTFSAYSDASGLSYFTGKDYNTLFSAFVSFTEISSPQVLVTDNAGQIYQSFDTGTTAAGTRLFAWFYDTATVTSVSRWAIVSGGGNPTGLNAEGYDAAWLAVAPSASDLNVIEVGTIYSQIYAESHSANGLVATSLFGDPEGANIVLIPEPSTGALISLGLSLLVLRKRKVTGEQNK